MRTLLLAASIAVLVPATPTRAASMKAARNVTQGLAHFAAGDYAAAGKAFADAQQAEPDDARIAFDRACAHAAAGDEADAIEQFRRAALSENPQLAARSHYNLGCLDVDKARAALGEKPLEAAAEVRPQAIELIETAGQHFRDALARDASDVDARHNLEAARLWVRHIEEAWRQRDRQQQREKMNLVEFLDMIEQEQRSLRSTCRTLADEPRSPRRRQAVFDTEKAQRQLPEEIEPLLGKIAAAMQSPQPGAPGAAAPSDNQQAIEILGGVADNARKAMLAAADRLGENNPAGAAPMQAEAVEQLDQIAMVVLPYVPLVQRAIDVQKPLVEQGGADCDDPEESAWNQRFVSRYTDVIRAKARQGLRAMPPSEQPRRDEAKEDKAPVIGPTLPPPTDDEDAETNEDPADAARQQQEALREAMQMAVELTPKVRLLSIEAVDHLEEEEPAVALPKQEEALKLLDEMLPEGDQQQDQQNQDQDKQDQQKNDEQQQDEQKPQPHDRQEKDERDQEQQQQQPRDLSKQQADAVLRKARQRQQERQEIEKQIQMYLYRPGEVEKDW